MRLRVVSGLPGELRNGVRVHSPCRTVRLQGRREPSLRRFEHGELVSGHASFWHRRLRRLLDGEVHSTSAPSTLERSAGRCCLPCGKRARLPHREVGEDTGGSRGSIASTRADRIPFPRWLVRESNPRRARLQRAALPAELTNQRAPERAQSSFRRSNGSRPGREVRPETRSY